MKLHRYLLRVGDRVIRISARSEQACFEAAEDICAYVNLLTLERHLLDTE